jgi:hypothetical protein
MASATNRSKSWIDAIPVGTGAVREASSAWPIGMFMK